MLSGTPFYNQTVRKSIAVFGTLFNNLYYTKPSKGKARVPISYGPAQKFISKINDAGADTDRIAIKLPRMSFEISSIDYDTARTLNKMNKLVYPVSADSPKRRNTLFQGVPYNLGITLTIIAKDQDSALQIVEQILPTFKPDYTVGIKDFHRPGMTMDVPIILNSVTLNDDYEGDYESSRVLTYTLEFTMKINFYGSVAKSATEALEHLSVIASETEHPRAFEVLSNMIKQTGDLTKELLQVQKQRKEITQGKDAVSNRTTNNAIFVGSTKELQKALRETKKAIDVTPEH
jgi:hypothetical protein